MASLLTERSQQGATLPPRPPTVRDLVDPWSSPMLDPPRTGTNVPLIHPPPSFVNVCPTHEEKFLIQDPKVIADVSQRRDNYRFTASPNTRVVYDSIDVGHRNGMQTPRNFISILQHGNLAPYYIPLSNDDRTLSFESRFESGNLRRAICISEYEYDLILRPDSSKKAYTQWYFFSVSNFRPGIPYTFNIINMYKPDSLHNLGMQPVVYSHVEATTKRVGWARGGENICYYRNSVRRNKSQYYYTLSFTYIFRHADDLCYFAHCYPYTYCNLQTDLMMLEADPERRKVIKRRPLCQTAAGNTCEMLTITAFSSTSEAIRSRKGIVITSRVHPGESCASWVMKGFIDFITGPSPDARFLRENFVFKIIPILNPDGVITGSYRCSSTGDDLNRNWTEPSKVYHPTIYNAKIMIQNFLADRPIMLFCDIHGHSRKRNVFLYGCGDDGSSQIREDRVFPRLLEIRSKMFSFVDSRFSVHRSKLATARVVMRREYDISNSYTLEASLAGYATSDASGGVHFSIQHFLQMGETFCLSLLDLLRERLMVQSIMNEAGTPSMSQSEQDVASDDSDYSSAEEDGEKKVEKKSSRKKCRKSKTRRNVEGKAESSLKPSHKSRASEESPLRPTPPLPRSQSSSSTAFVEYTKPTTPTTPKPEDFAPPPVCLKERLRRLHQAANEYFLRSLQNQAESMETRDFHENRYVSPMRADDDIQIVDEDITHRTMSARARSISEPEQSRATRSSRPTSAASARHLLTIRRLEQAAMQQQSQASSSETYTVLLSPYQASKLPRIPRPAE